ncbi:putative purine permease 11 [Acorus calamus]|uniref:Probable purine permease n=1 Tax=Acorus calamus TaxID=4465 RepID=A0AAV9DQK8_ACOCL|nr:putative purine permease 11 [Acorus calamus]
MRERERASSFCLLKMGEELQLHIREVDPTQPPPSEPPPPPTTTSKHWKWWLTVTFNILSLLVGQTVATLLGRYYYSKGGNSIWLATIVQSLGYPILLIPLILSFKTKTSITRPPLQKLSLLYASLGLLVGFDNLLYSYGLLYLPLSTYSLVCATQLAFNTVFSRFLNGQRFTHLVLNSVVLLSVSASLLGVRAGSEAGNARIPPGKYAIGFVCTLGASAAYSLLLSLTQLSFEKVMRGETYRVVLEMQVSTSAVASCVALVGLFASGEWRTLKGEMNDFEAGRAAYVAALVGTAVGWQVSAIGVVGLIFQVSSLFSNVISTLALPVVPVFAVIFFHDKMDGVKVMALLLALWGFASYMYQHYIDDLEAKKAKKASTRNDVSNSS